MKRIVMAGAILLSSIVSYNLAVAAAAPPTPEQQAATATANRQAVFKLLATQNGVLGAMGRPGGTYNKDAAVLATQRIEILAGMIPELFAADTMALNHGGATSRATAGIWGAKADFDMLANDLAAAAVAARATLEAEAAPDMAALSRSVGTKCGACHDRFRAE
jgi:cytochrome c556